MLAPQIVDTVCRGLEYRADNSLRRAERARDNAHPPEEKTVKLTADYPLHIRKRMVADYIRRHDLVATMHEAILDEADMQRLFDAFLYGESLLSHEELWRALMTYVCRQIDKDIMEGKP